MTDNNEYHTICEIGKERIRRADEKIKLDNAGKEGIDNLDIGFRVLKLDSTNMRDVYYAAGEYTQDLLSLMEDNIKDNRTDMDLFCACLLDWGLPLSMPHTQEKIDGFTVLTYNDGDLIACLDKHISDAVVREIANRQPLRAVFRDSSFSSSPEKINVEEIFRLLTPNTSVRVKQEDKVILYTMDNGNVTVSVRFEDENFWMTQKAIAELFETDRTSSRNISRTSMRRRNWIRSQLVKNLHRFKPKEVVRLRVWLEFYNLDAIIAVGYRVNSKKATRFRQWATKTLHQYIQKGFVLNDELLKTAGLSAGIILTSCWNASARCAPASGKLTRRLRRVRAMQLRL